MTACAEMHGYRTNNDFRKKLLFLILFSWREKIPLFHHSPPKIIFISFSLQVMWDDVIGEPEGLRSTDCAWNCSYKCFRGTKNCCYILLITLFAPCLAFCAAINFACLAFQVGQEEREGDCASRITWRHFFCSSIRCSSK